MTAEQVDRFRCEFETLVKKFTDEDPSITAWNWDSNMEAGLVLLSHCIDTERDHERHPLVRGCLESVVDSLRNAAMDYYVSTK